MKYFQNPFNTGDEIFSDICQSEYASFSLVSDFVFARILLHLGTT